MSIMSHTFDDILDLLQQGKLQELWPDGVIPYRISPSFREDFKNIVFTIVLRWM